MGVNLCLHIRRRINMVIKTSHPREAWQTSVCYHVTILAYGPSADVSVRSLRKPTARPNVCCFLTVEKAEPEAFNERPLDFLGRGGL